MAFIRSFMSVLFPLALLFLLLGFLDLLSGFKFGLVGHFRLAFNATTLRMGRFQAPFVILYRKYRWFLPILVVIFLVSVPLGIFFIIFDIFTIIWLLAKRSDMARSLAEKREAFKDILKGAEDKLPILDLDIDDDGRIVIDAFVDTEEVMINDTRFIGDNVSMRKAFNKLPTSTRIRIAKGQLVSEEEGVKSYEFTTSRGVLSKATDE